MSHRRRGVYYYEPKICQHGQERTQRRRVCLADKRAGRAEAREECDGEAREAAGGLQPPRIRARAEITCCASPGCAWKRNSRGV
jgi:hypothetical protein